MTRNIADEYFEWLFDLVSGNRHPELSYRKLLMHLHRTEFRYHISNDDNRAGDGIELRYRFKFRRNLDFDHRKELPGPCSVLEMLVALALRCEETIMDDPDYGDRTSQWFWRMIKNLGLDRMLDSRYDESYVEEVVNRFLDREYEPDGRGGLFTVKNCDCDLREVEIWTQMMWFLNDIF